MCLQQIEELIARDKNHASVVMWCVANKPLPSRLRTTSGANHEVDPTIARGKVFLETLIRRTRELDPVRPVTLTTVMGGPTGWMEQCDVICMNRYWSW
jgi:beta-glucuronidase